MMSFSDLRFLFRFLPGVMLCFFLTPPRFRRFCLLCASFLFYLLLDPGFFPLLVVVIFLNHVLGRYTAKQVRSAFVSSVTINVLLLVSLKIYALSDSLFLLPLGISFYTFKMISYQADLYAKKISPHPSFLDTALYLSFFPQILSGPIMRYTDYKRASSFSLSALKSPRTHRADLLAQAEEGAFYLCAGLAFKVLIADHLAMCWMQIGTIGYAHLSTPLAWIGVVCYSLNLYYDFWGYSLMAAGIGVALGFPFIENFHHPYAAPNVAAFYRRWHITLGAFLRDTVYIPLGGSKKGALRTVASLFVVWIITSLWHGTGLTFVIWGMSLFVLILLEKFVHVRLPRIPALILGRVHVLLLVPLTWIPFAMGKLSYLTGYLSSLFPFLSREANVYAADYVLILRDYLPYFAAGLLFLVPFFFSFLEKRRRHPVCVLLMLSLFWLSAYSLSGAAANPFMYLRF